MSDHKLLSVKELAGKLRLSVTETYRLIQSGEINHFRVGPSKGAIRICESEVREFLERRRIGKPKPSPAAAPRSRPLKHIQTKNLLSHGCNRSRPDGLIQCPARMRGIFYATA